MSRGQASVEYVAAIALVAIVLAVGTVAVAAPGLPGAVADKLRLALCIVGGDVCRPSDAAARGLEPCVTSAADHERETGLTFLFIRGSGNETYAIERLSDGRIRLSAGYGQGASATAGIGVQLGQLRAGGSAQGGLGFNSGQTWVLPDEAALRAVLARVPGYDLHNALRTFGRIPQPAETYLEGGGDGGAQLAVQALKEVPGGGGQARSFLGRRRAGRDTTYYLDLGASTTGPLVSAVPALDARGRVLAEYTTGSPPVITLRAATRGSGDTETETVMRLPLGDQADRRAAQQVAFVALANPALAIADLVTRIRARGTVEQLRYRTRTRSRQWAYGLDLGAALGADHRTSVTTRELVGAQVLNGPFPATRLDCLQGA